MTRSIAGHRYYVVMSHPAFNRDVFAVGRDIFAVSALCVCAYEHARQAVRPIASLHRVSLIICVSDLGTSMLQKPPDCRHETMGTCCEQEGSVPCIVSLSYGCAPLLKKQILDYLHTSTLSSVKKGSLAIDTSICDSRTVP
jgi:hypothetical protein